MMAITKYCPLSAIVFYNILRKELIKKNPNKPYQKFKDQIIIRSEPYLLSKNSLI